MKAPLTREAGFTLIELLIVVAILAILVAVATPSYQWTTKTNRIATELNALVGDFQFARSEAIKQGQNVTVCSSTDGATCAAGSWGGGWIVFVDPLATGSASGAVILRNQRALGSGDTLAAGNNQANVMFNREGYASNVAGTLIFSLRDQAASAGATRCVSLNIVGQLTPLRSGQTGCS